jgi:hypothetical protein
VVDALSPTERKAAHKNLQVVQFTGTLPPTTILWNLIWIHGNGAERSANLTLQNAGKVGRVRLAIPRELKFDPSDDTLRNLEPLETPELSDYVGTHLASLRKLARAGLSPKEECDRMSTALRLLKDQPVFVIAEPTRPASVLNLQVPAEGSYGVLIGVERADDMRLGDSWRLSVDEGDPENRELASGGSVYDIAFVRSPRTRLDLKLSARRRGTTGITVTVACSSDGAALTEDDGVEVQVAIGRRAPLAAIYSARAGAFVATVRTPAGVPKRVRVTATAWTDATQVRETADVTVTA